MRLHLVTVEGAEQSGEVWAITPAVPLNSLAANLMMPMSGDEIELILPDGQHLTAHVASFGVSVWQDSKGNFYVLSDPADPALTLTITCSPDVEAIPAGTEIWLSNARTALAAEGA